MVEPTRRMVLGACGLGLAAAMAGPSIAAARRRTLALPPGLQLWTVGSELKRDFDGTLRQLRKIGYRQVETAGWLGRSPADFRRAVTSAGLKIASCHFSMGDLIDEHETELAQARDVGARYIVASSPAISKPLARGKPWPVAVAEAMTLDDWHRNADAMNRIGAQARAMGMRFGYHNHPAEFMTIDGRFVWDELLRLTNPADICFELDLGWVAAAGYDPAAILKKDAARIELLHVKDIAAREREPGRIASQLTTTPVGAGSIDWRATFAAADQAPIKAWFVEQEPPFTHSPMEGVAESLGYLRALRG
jgi:sugar phosphate isomerase/epimerase